VRASHARLLHLDRIDERITAHLDGIAVAGEAGIQAALSALEHPGAGEVFVASLRLLEEADARRLDNIISVAEAVPAARAGLVSAFGWARAAQLRGIADDLLHSAHEARRVIGLAACAMHGIDPGRALVDGIRSEDEFVRAYALRVAGRLGKQSLLDNCLARVDDRNECCAYRAAESALLLGDRGTSIERLEAIAAETTADDCLRRGALSVMLKAVTPDRASACVARLARSTGEVPLVIYAAGVAGDPYYVPWLIAQMEKEEFARSAGAAFSMITGVDLADVRLERSPGKAATAPNDDPADANVDLDSDDGLPWPDAAKVDAWWSASGKRFVSGVRHFLGAPPSQERCAEVLLGGFQRSRIAAAHYWTLLDPGTPLFDTSAPAWRQRHRLASSAA
jgi:uncharacterized protein (TIGR02270 family)